MKQNHKIIFLQFLENYKQLTFFELSILSEFFKKRLADFNSENELIAYKDLKPNNSKLENKFVVPPPSSITKFDNSEPILRLTDFAKVNFSFIYSFCDLVVSDVTLRTIQKQLKINYRTAYFWRYKIFMALREYMDTLILKKTIYFDEIFVKVSNLQVNKRQNVINMRNKPLTGKAVVSVACDEFGTVICKNFGESTKVIEQYYDRYHMQVEKDSTVIGDSHAGLSKLISELGLTDNRVKYDESNPMVMSELQPINSLSSTIKRFIEQKHHGITIENLQDYLNLISFKQTLAKHHFYHNQMVIFLVELIYSSSQKLLFRDLFPRKKDDVAN